MMKLHPIFRRLSALALIAIFIGGATMARAKTPSVVLIPRPQKMEVTGGAFQITPQTVVAAVSDQSGKTVPEDMKFFDQYLRDILKPIHLAAEEKKTEPPQKSIMVWLMSYDKSAAPESYQLEVTESGIKMSAGTPAGLFYAIQTLRQLLPPQIEDPKTTNTAWSVPCLKITDSPRFPHRGLLLDCCRHFSDKDHVKRVIDLMVRYKLNTLHWHLTDDQGWRIEIKKYPKLTAVGAWRDGENGKLYPDGKLQGGFYTQDDIREIIAYAASRYVTIIPEIEMPGHSQAALAAYPELSCTGGPFKTGIKWGVIKDVYCAGNDKTLAMLEDVLTEVMDLFPSKEIHLGGDECPKDRWKACPKCQARIKAEGLKDENELQSWFMKRMAAFVQQHGRRAVCWDEVLEEGLRGGIVVQEWRNHNPAVPPEKAGPAAKAAALGLDAVVSPSPTWYLDVPIERPAGKRGGRKASLQEAYALDPLPAGLDPKLAGHILGGEGNVWTEHIPQDQFDAWAFPRLLAVAEVLWAPAEGKKYEEFAARVGWHEPRMKAIGIKYGPGMPQFQED